MSARIRTLVVDDSAFARKVLRQVRAEMGVPSEPLKAYVESGYQKRIEELRGIRSGAGGLGQ